MGLVDVANDLNMILFESEILFISGLSLSAVSTFLLIYWSFIIFTRLRLNIKQYKAYIKSRYFDKHVYSKLKFAFETVRNRDIFLLILIVLEIAMLLAVTIPLPLLNVDQYESEFVKKKINETFPDCHVNCMVAVSYIYPIYAFAIISIVMLVLTQLIFMSFLNSYLACRYLGHSFPRKSVFKYVLFWIFLYVIQTICIIPWLQILFPFEVLLFFINWIILVYTTRHMCKAIRSRMREIELFEWNPESYRTYSRDLKHYKIAMGIVILANFFLIIAIFVITFEGFLEILFSNYCYLVIVFQLDPIHKPHIPYVLNVFYTFLDTFGTYIACVFAMLDAILLLTPSLFLFLCHFVNRIYHIGTGRAYFNRINRTLFDPLLHQY